MDGSSAIDTTTAPAAISVRLRRTALLLDLRVIIVISMFGFSLVIIIGNFLRRLL